MSRQTDIFIDKKKVNPDLFVIEIEICTCIYNIVNLLKSYDNIHSMTYITKIMLTGIAIRNTGYILKIKLKGIARDKIATMYDMLIIYIVAKKTLWKA